MFLDADVEENRGFERPVLGDFFTPCCEGRIFSNEVFEKMNSMIERKNTDIEEASRTLPRLRIGVLVPESKAQALAQKKDEVRGNHMGDELQE